MGFNSAFKGLKKRFDKDTGDMAVTHNATEDKQLIRQNLRTCCLAHIL
jgi:hypothetical protein